LLHAFSGRREGVAWTSEDAAWFAEHRFQPVPREEGGVAVVGLEHTPDCPGCAAWEAEQPVTVDAAEEAAEEEIDRWLAEREAAGWPESDREDGRLTGVDPLAGRLPGTP